jgi:hypothetical protein
MLAEPGYHTRAFVEWEEYPRSVLIAAQRAGYFAHAPIWTDLRAFDARPFRGAFDTVLAGYPCQPFSAAGKRGGADDPRHLWPEVARVIGECRPEWVFLENVAGHVTLGLETVLRELWGLGYTPAAGLFSAAEVGAPHERLRVFIVAHTDEPAPRHGPLQPGREQRLHAEGRGAGAGHQELVDTQGDGRRKGWPGPELWHGRDATPASAGSAMADPGRPELEGQFGGQHHPQRRQVPDGPAALPGGAGLHPPGPGDLAGWAAVLGSRPDLAPAVSVGDVWRACDHLAALVEAGRMEEAEAESRVRLMAHGLSSRASRLRLLGNAVVPIQAAYAWVTLSAAHGLEPQ